MAKSDADKLKKESGEQNAATDEMKPDNNCPATETNRGRWAWFLKAIPVFVLVVSILTLSKSIFDFNLDNNKALAESNKERLREWQSVIVYKLVKDATTPLSLQDISSKYLDEATKQDALEIPKSELQDFVLERILMDLTMSQLVYLTYDGKYSIQRSSAEDEARNEVVGILSSESGRYTIAELNNRLSKKTQLSGSEFNTLIGKLITEGLVGIQNNKVWFVTAPHPPQIYVQGVDGKYRLVEVDLSNESKPARPSP